MNPINGFSKLTKLEKIDKIVGAYFNGSSIYTDELKRLEGGDVEPYESNPLLGLRGIHKDLNNELSFTDKLLFGNS